MSKQFIKNYPGLVWMQVNGVFVKKATIVLIDDREGSVEFQMNNGTRIHSTGSDATKALGELGFNQNDSERFTKKRVK